MILIDDDKEFRKHILKNEIRRSQIAEGVISYCYLISDSTTFSDAYYKECRGITFTDGVISSRPLHKFKNVNECPETAVSVLPWDNVTRVMLKRDGSMVHPVRMKDGSWKFVPRRGTAAPQDIPRDLAHHKGSTV